MAKVLFVYYSVSHQTERAVDAMAEVLSTRSHAVTRAVIEFTDPHDSGRALDIYADHRVPLTRAHAAVGARPSRVSAATARMPARSLAARW